MNAKLKTTEELGALLEIIADLHAKGDKDLALYQLEEIQRNAAEVERVKGIEEYQALRKRLFSKHIKYQILEQAHRDLKVHPDLKYKGKMG